MARQALAALLIFCAVAALYGFRLDASPAALHPDEIALGAQARAVAETGRDLDGERLPLFFRLHDHTWTAPLPVYVTALVVRSGGGHYPAIRLASVVAAAVDAVAMFFVALRLFKRWTLAALAAAMLALDPLHFIHGRLALASVYSVAFVLGWLGFLIAFVERRAPAALFAATLCLGFGFYSAPTAVLMTSIYLAVTGSVLLAIRAPAPRYAVAAAGFAVPLVVLIPWFATHHDVFRVTLGDWGLHTLANPRDGLRYSVFNWATLATRTTVFWSFFSPSFLFVSGGDDLVSSTHQSGILLALTAIPLLYGVIQIATTRWSEVAWRSLLVAFAASPIAAAAFGVPKAAGRALDMLPFAILIATYGLDRLLDNGRTAVRVVAVALLLLMPLQFVRFYGDYFTRYPQRSSGAFRQGVPIE